MKLSCLHRRKCSHIPIIAMFVCTDARSTEYSNYRSHSNVWPAAGLFALGTAISFKKLCLKISSSFDWQQSSERTLQTQWSKAQCRRQHFHPLVAQRQYVVTSFNMSDLGYCGRYCGSLFLSSLPEIRSFIFGWYDASARVRLVVLAYFYNSSAKRGLSFLQF